MVREALIVEDEVEIGQVLAELCGAGAASNPLSWRREPRHPMGAATQTAIDPAGPDASRRGCFTVCENLKLDRETIYCRSSWSRVWESIAIGFTGSRWGPTIISPSPSPPTS